MVAFANTCESKTPLRVRALRHSCILGVSPCLNSNHQANFREVTYDECFRLESCSKDPIGYRSGSFSQYKFLRGRVLGRVDPLGLKECKVKSFIVTDTPVQLMDKNPTDGVNLIGFHSKVVSRAEFEGPCCECCEYRQLVLASNHKMSIINPDGSEQVLVDIVEDVAEGKEDCVVVGGFNYCYGRKNHPKPTGISTYSDDECSYEGIDYPGFDNIYPNVERIGHGAKLFVDFYLRLHHSVIDVCNNGRTVVSRTTDISGTGSFSGSDF